MKIPFPFFINKINPKRMKKLENPPVCEPPIFEPSDDIFESFEPPFSDSYSEAPSIEHFIDCEIIQKALSLKSIRKKIENEKYDFHLYIEISELIKDTLPDVWDENQEFLKKIFDVDDINILLNGSPVISRRFNYENEKDLLDTTVVFYRAGIAKRILGQSMVTAELYITDKDDGIMGQSENLIFTKIVVPNEKKDDWQIKTFI